MMTLSPGRLHSANNTGGQVTMAVNTPIASTSAIQVATKEIDATPPKLFDPTHIPTIYPRIQSLSRLLIEASNNAHSLSIPQEQSSNFNQLKTTNITTTSSSNIIAGPDLAMGAMDEDDVNDGFEAALSLSFGVDEGQQKIKRTELAQNIVLESRELRETFDRARIAIDSMDGGEMDIDEQERLILLLRDYSAEQRRVLEAFQKNDVQMDID